MLHSQSKGEDWLYWGHIALSNYSVILNKHTHIFMYIYMCNWTGSRVHTFLQTLPMQLCCGCTGNAACANMDSCGSGPKWWEWVSANKKAWKTSNTLHTRVAKIYLYYYYIYIYLIDSMCKRAQDSISWSIWFRPLPYHTFFHVWFHAQARCLRSDDVDFVNLTAKCAIPAHPFGRSEWGIGRTGSPQKM
jgi:hypothetical protein